jgi:cell shape-determining protein MreC
MKMNFRRQSSNRGRYIFFSLFAIVALILGFGFRDATVSIIAVVGKPVLKGTFSIIQSTTFTTSLFGSKADLVRERDALSERNRVLESEKETEAIARLYGEDVQKVIARAMDERIVSSVFSRPNFTPYDSLLLDKGKKDGVKEGSLVYGTGNRVIGYIAHAYDTISHTVLFSTAGVQSVVYMPSTRTLVRAVGFGGGVIRLSIPQGIHVKEGDEVSYPTLSPSPIGKITRIVKTDTNPDIFGYVTISDSPFNLFVVSIGTGDYQSPSKNELEKNMQFATTTAQTFFKIPEGYTVSISTTTATTTATSTIR